jgi:hypothetical protein
VISFTAWPLYPQGKIPQYPLDKRLGGPRASLDMEKRKFLTLPGLKLQPLGLPPVAKKTIKIYILTVSNNVVIEPIGPELLEAAHLLPGESVHSTSLHALFL